MFKHGGVRGPTNNSKRFLGFFKLMIRMLYYVDPAFQYTSLALITQGDVPPHRDKYNAPASNLLLPLKLPSKGVVLRAEALVGDIIQGPLEQLQSAIPQCVKAPPTMLFGCA